MKLDEWPPVLWRPAGIRSGAFGIRLVWFWYSLGGAVQSIDLSLLSLCSPFVCISSGIDLLLTVRYTQFNGYEFAEAEPLFTVFQSGMVEPSIPIEEIYYVVSWTRKSLAFCSVAGLSSFRIDTALIVWLMAVGGVRWFVVSQWQLPSVSFRFDGIYSEGGTGSIRRYDLYSWPDEEQHVESSRLFPKRIKSRNNYKK